MRISDVNSEKLVQEMGGDESAYIVNGDDQAGKVATQLGLELDSIKAALCSLSTITRGVFVS